MIFRVILPTIQFSESRKSKGSKGICACERGAFVYALLRRSRNASQINFNLPRACELLAKLEAIRVQAMRYVFFCRVSKCEGGIECKSNSDSRETRLQTRRGQRRGPGNKITSSIVRKWIYRYPTDPFLTRFCRLGESRIRHATLCYIFAQTLVLKNSINNLS